MNYKEDFDVIMFFSFRKIKKQNLQAIPKQMIEVTGIKKQLIVGKLQILITIHLI